MTKIDYVITTYNKRNYTFGVRVRYENSRDIHYNPKQLPSTVRKFMRNATHIRKNETSITITETYCYEVD